MSKLRRPRKKQKRLEIRIRDWEATCERIQKRGDSYAGFKKPGSGK